MSAPTGARSLRPASPRAPRCSRRLAGPGAAPRVGCRQVQAWAGPDCWDVAFRFSYFSFSLAGLTAACGASLLIGRVLERQKLSSEEQKTLVEDTLQTLRTETRVDISAAEGRVSDSIVALRVDVTASEGRVSDSVTLLRTDMAAAMQAIDSRVASQQAALVSLTADVVTALTKLASNNAMPLRSQLPRDRQQVGAGW